MEKLRAFTIAGRQEAMRNGAGKSPSAFAAGGICVAALACVGLFAAPVLAFPIVALTLPALMLWVMNSMGALVGAVCVAALCAATGISSAPWVAVLPLIVILPPVALHQSGAMSRRPFQIRLYMMMGCLCACAVTALAVVWRALGASPMLAAVDALENWLANNAQGNPFLLNAYRFGLARMREGSPFTLRFGGATWIAPAHLRELTDSLLYTVRSLLSAWLPGWVVTGAAAGAALMTSQVKEENAIEASNPYNGNGDEKAASVVPPFGRWRLTDGWGGLLAGAAMSLMLLNLFSGGALGAASAIGSAVFQAVMAVQGVSVMESALEKRSAPKVLRMVLIGLCFVIFGMACFWVGLADALFDLRKIHGEDERGVMP